MIITHHEFPCSCRFLQECQAKLYAYNEVTDYAENKLKREDDISVYKYIFLN